MASTSNPSFFFLLFLVISSAQIEARVNKFFSKFIHTNHNEVPQLTPLAPSPSPVPEISPISPPAEAPAPFFDESQNAYGLYGRDSDDGETITDVEEKILADNGEESTESSYSETNLQKDEFGNPRSYEQNQNKYENNNGYRNSEYNNKEYRNSEYESNFENNEESAKSSYSETNLQKDDFENPRRYEQNHNNYENNNGYRNSEYESNIENNGEKNYQYESNFENSGYRWRRNEPSERQGMSDTRFMENGRYFHDVNSRNGEEAGESYGNKKNQYEFDSMEEYEKSEGFLP